MINWICQKALKLEDDLKKKKPYFDLTRTYWAFEKYDGWFGYFDTHEGKVRASSGREIPSCVALSRLLSSKTLSTGTNYRIIFEILVEDVPDFATVNGILNRKQVDPRIYVRIHDIVAEGGEDVQFSERYRRVCAFVEQANHQKIKIAQTLGEVRTKDEALYYAKQVWDRGGEGVILKERNEPYYFSEGKSGKRHGSLIKIKMELTDDLKVTGIERGQGKYAHTLGVLIVKDKSGREHRVSGMTDYQRDLWWQHPGKIIGHIVECAAMERLDNGSLREPRFKDVRYDKAESDID